MTTPISSRSGWWCCLLLTSAMLWQSCASPQALVESGNYDAAIEVAVRKLAGKKNKKAKYVQALEEAFAKVTDRDMQLAERLKAENRPENWERINELYRNIRRRQERIEPLLPLMDKHGVKANFRFVRVDGLEIESREKAAEHLYENARRLLADARSGDKRAAREAYGDLERISQYYRNYRDRDQLMDEALALGTVYVLFHIRNDAPVVLPAGFEEEITRFGVGDMNTKWKVYHQQKRSGVEYDFEAIMRITDIAVSPEVFREREYEDAKEIQDGFEYVLDERGNVRKDSLGNDVKVPRKITVRARVLEAYQQKVAAVSGRLELVDLRSRQLLDTQPLTTEAIFENYASTFSGDERALSEETKRRIGNRPRPFPSDEVLLLIAAEQLKPVVKEKVARTRGLI